MIQPEGFAQMMPRQLLRCFTVPLLISLLAHSPLCAGVLARVGDFEIMETTLISYRGEMGEHGGDSTQMNVTERAELLYEVAYSHAILEAADGVPDSEALVSLLPEWLEAMAGAGFLPEASPELFTLTTGLNVSVAALPFDCDFTPPLHRDPPCRNQFLVDVLTLLQQGEGEEFAAQHFATIIQFVSLLDQPRLPESESEYLSLVEPAVRQSAGYGHAVAQHAYERYLALSASQLNQMRAQVKDILIEYGTTEADPTPEEVLAATLSAMLAQSEFQLMHQALGRQVEMVDASVEQHFWEEYATRGEDFMEFAQFIPYFDWPSSALRMEMLPPPERPSSPEPDIRKIELERHRESRTDELHVY